MIISIFVFGMLLVVGGILGMIISDSSYSIFFISGLIIVSISILIEPEPTKQDVLDRKAIYQETQVITGNDTIKTYEIVWKQKN